MDARKVIGIPAGRELGTYEGEKICEGLVEIYKDLLAMLPDDEQKFSQLIARAQAARDALIWEGWKRTVMYEEPWNDYTGKPPHDKLVQMLKEYADAPDLEWLENEPDQDLRNRLFRGKNRVLLMLGREDLLDLGDISEHDIDSRIRQGYLAELRGDTDTAQQIYHSVGFTERLSEEDDEGPLLDEEVEHYTE